MNKSMGIIMDKICEVIDDAADKISRGGKPSIGELKELGELIDIKKNILKAEALEEDGGYSRAGDWEARGRFGDQYARDRGYNDGGSSNANRGEHYVRGHYSHADGRSKMMEYLEKALDSADERDREDIRRFMRKLESA